MIDLDFNEEFMAKLHDLKLNKTPQSCDGEEGICLLTQEEIQEELDLYYFNRAVDTDNQGV